MTSLFHYITQKEVLYFNEVGVMIYDDVNMLESITFNSLIVFHKQNSANVSEDVVYSLDNDNLIIKIVDSVDGDDYTVSSPNFQFEKEEVISTPHIKGVVSKKYNRVGTVIGLFKDNIIFLYGFSGLFLVIGLFVNKRDDEVVEDTE